MISLWVPLVWCFSEDTRMEDTSVRIIWADQWVDKFFWMLVGIGLAITWVVGWQQADRQYAADQAVVQFERDSGDRRHRDLVNRLDAIERDARAIRLRVAGDHP